MAVFVFTIQTSFAQTDFSCGTTGYNFKSTNLQQRTTIGRFTGAHRNHDGSLKDGLQPACKKVTIKVRVNIIEDALGNSGSIPKILTTASGNVNIENDIINKLNAAYNPKINFELQGSLNEIANDNYFNNTTYNLIKYGDTDGDGKFDEFSPATDLNAIDIYLIGNGKGGDVGGIAADIGASAVILFQYNQNDGKVICHEIGHCLGLFHTFHGTACKERDANSWFEFGGLNSSGVYSGNGYSAGDYVWDTWPDPIDYATIWALNSGCRFYVPPPPNLPTYTYDVWCGSNPNLKTDVADPMGNIWQPWVNNFMDYDRAIGCTLQFTAEQIERMLIVIANDNVVNKTVNITTKNITIDPTVDILRCSNNTNSITLTASTPPDDVYNYIWKENSAPSIILSTTNQLTIVPTATSVYTVTGTSMCFDDASSSKVVTVNDGVTLTISGNQYLCAGTPNASFTVSSNTNTPPSSGTWEVINAVGSQGNFTNPSSGNLTFTNNVEGEITIKFTSADQTNPTGCYPSVTKTIYIVPTNPTVTVTSSASTICLGNEAVLTATGSTGVTYQWSGSGTASPPNTFTVKPLTAGTYNYNVTVTNSCNNNTYTLPSPVQITVNPLPVITPVKAMPQFMCSGSTASYDIQYNVDGIDYPERWTFSSLTATTINISDGYTTTNNQHALSLNGSTNTGTFNYVYTYDDNICTKTVEGIIKVYPTTTTIKDGNGTVITNTTVELCQARTSQLSSNIPGGTWSSSNETVAIVDKLSGAVTGVGAGNAQITYTSTYCTTTPVSITVQVKPSLYFTKVTNTICAGSSFDKFEVNMGPQGDWRIVSTNPSTLPCSLSNTGLLSLSNPLVTGTINIQYDVPSSLYATNNCISNVLDYGVKVINCPSNCSSTASGITIAKGTHTNKTFYSGIYTINEDITFAGKVNFIDAQVQVAPNVTITLADNATLTIEGTHFYSCSGMWQGIRATSKNNIVNIIGSSFNSSLIEDAEVAVLYQKTNNYGTRTFDYVKDNFLTINNTIFNRNNISIKVVDVEVTNYFNLNYPLSIYNCVFTSRNIPFDPSVTSSWVDVASLRRSNSSAGGAPFVTPQSYSAPYIDNTIYADNITDAFLKDGTAANKPQAGIVIIGCGFEAISPLANTDLLGNNNRTYVKIGGTSVGGNTSFEPNTNVFDNLQVGIDADKSSLYIHNSIFQNSVNTTTGGIGIKVLNGVSNESGYFGLFTVANTYDNAFYNVKKAVSVKDFKNVLIQNCHISSNYNVTNPTDVGDYGIVVSLLNSPGIKVNNNIITNIKNGIWLSTGAVEPENAILRQPLIEVNNNTIREKFTSLSATNTYLKNAINIDFYNITGNNNASVKVKNNTIGFMNNINDGAVNGIKVSGLNGLDISGNNIQLAEDKLTPAITDQYGILQEPHIVGATSGFTLPAENIIEDNTINGYNAYGTATTTGIYLKQSLNNKVQCNTVSDLTHGFRFYGGNQNTKFWDNTMSYNNLYGFTLSGSAVIGAQGIDNPPATVCSSNNTWVDASAWHNDVSNTSAPNYMTYCEDSDPLNSPLYVLNSPSSAFLNPHGSSYTNDNAGINKYKYDAASLSASSIKLVGSNINCTRCQTPVTAMRTAADLNIMEQIADGTISILNDDAEDRLLVMQEQLYELINANTSMLANSITLQQFLYNNQWTSLDFIYYAGKLMAEGNYEMVEMLLDYWPDEHSNLNESYYTYFQWLVDMYNDPSYRPDDAAVLELANQCPLKYGTIIFAVRNLYNALTEKINDFEDHCDNTAARGGNKPQFIRLKQPKTVPVVQEKQAIKPLIYPNPANGMVNIAYTEIKQIDIIDVNGKTLLHKQGTGFNNMQLNISNLPRGIYLVRVLDKNGKSEPQKLILQ